MHYVVDASAIVNLNNAGVLELLGALEEHTFWVTPMVVDECQPSCAVTLAAELETNGIRALGVDELSTARFLDLLDTYSLGNGETESILACEAKGYGLCCDDKRARRLGRELLGDQYVVGTMRILRWGVLGNNIDCRTAFNLFLTMKGCGGFLPNSTAQGDFCMHCG